MSNRFSGSMGRHKFIIGILMVFALSGALFACYWVVQNDRNGIPAGKLFDEAIILLAQDRRKEALEKFEAAEKLQPGICKARSDWFNSHEFETKEPLQLTGYRKLVRVNIVDLGASGLSKEQQARLYRERLAPFLSSPCSIPNEYEMRNLTEMQLFSLYEKDKPSDALAMLDRAATLYSFSDSIFASAQKLYSERNMQDKLRFLRANRLSREDEEDLRQIGNSPLTSGQWTILNRIVNKYPNNPLPLLYRINAQLVASGSRSLQNAIADCNRVIALCPDLADGYDARGRVYQRLDKLEESLADFDEASKRMPDSIDLLKSQAAVAEKLKRTKDALAFLDRIILLSPFDQNAMTEKAEYLYRVGDYNQTEQAINQAIEVATMAKRLDSLAGYAESAGFSIGPGALFTEVGTNGLRQGLARVRTKKGDYEGALAIVEELLESEPQLATNYDIKADVLLLSKQPALARDAAVRALEIQKSPVERSDNNSLFPSEPVLTPPTTFEPGMLPRDGAIERYERLATIYDALHDSANAEKQRRNKLMLLKLNVYSEPYNDFLLSTLIDYADRLDEYRAAIWATRAFCEASPPATSGYDPQSDPQVEINKRNASRTICEKLLVSKHPDFAFRVINEFSRLTPGDEKLAQFREQALKRCGTSSAPISKT